MIHIGDKKTPAGRYDEKPTLGLSDQLRKYDFKLGRLKTGTPPRLDGTTINYDNLDHMTGDTLNQLAEIFQLEDFEISEITDKLDKEVKE